MRMYDKFPSIYPVAAHTDNVGPGTTFVAIKGTSFDGAEFIPEAIKKGATTVVLGKREILPSQLEAYLIKSAISIVRVDNTRQALAILSAQKAGFPAKKLKVIGVTGTKGKTTTVFLLEHILRYVGYKVGLISSVYNSINGQQLKTAFATPQPDYLQQFLASCRDETVEYVIMEVSAQALSLFRVHGIEFDGIVFTNFSHEHLEFYETLDDYFRAKVSIFDQSKEGAPIFVNGDDPRAAELKLAAPTSVRFGFISTENELKAHYHEPSLMKGMITLHSNNASDAQIESPLMGKYNGYNLLAVIGMALKIGISYGRIQEALAVFTGIPGRLQMHILSNGAIGVIDYAHNPSSYEAVLSALRQKTDHLIVIFGAGGSRDKYKRPIMGRIAALFADQVILTADNPRFEDPVAISIDIERGIPSMHKDKVIHELDREKAIRLAYALSKPGSMIVLLGKGPNEYQEVQGIKIPFSESKIMQTL